LRGLVSHRLTFKGHLFFQPMHKPNEIRLLALALIRDKNRIFLSEGYDPVKEQTFYRALGGGVDFGEFSRDALQREFLEEIQAEIKNIQYLGCIENLFVFNGLPGHEIIQLYECDFVDPKFYQMNEVSFVEGTRKKKAVWVDIERFKNQELRLVPEVFFEYL
jgi:8-oxo-dGTP pyrophosphatase MutT (NUDIX family)